jgi:head-tail adaptor
MRRRITLWRPVRTRQATGEDQVAWRDFALLWAWVVPATTRSDLGEDSLAGGSEILRDMLYVRLSKRPTYCDEGCRLTTDYKGVVRRYEIVAITEGLDTRGPYCQLYCRPVVEEA